MSESEAASEFGPASPSPARARSNSRSISFDAPTSIRSSVFKSPEAPSPGQSLLHEETPTRSRSPRERPIAALQAHGDAGRATPANAQHGPVPPAWLRPSVQPKMTIGTEWWCQPLYTSLESERAKLPPVSGPLAIELNCAGAASELAICETMGIPVQVVSMCERKVEARKFIKQRWSEVCGDGSGCHLFGNF